MYFREIPQLTESSVLISSSFLFLRYPESLDPFPSRSKSDGEIVREEFGGGTLIVQTTPRQAMCELHESSF